MAQKRTQKMEGFNHARVRIITDGNAASGRVYNAKALHRRDNESYRASSPYATATSRGVSPLMVFTSSFAPSAIRAWVVGIFVARWPSLLDVSKSMSTATCKG